MAEVMWLDESEVISLSELVEISGLSEDELLELVHAGAIPSRENALQEYTFSARVVTTARTACRLRDDLELDPHGLALAIKLLERVRELEAELARLRALAPRS